MRILFAGTPSTAIPALRALLASHHEVVGVLTRPDARKGRGKRLAPSPVAEVAEEAGVPVLKYSSLKSEETRQDVLALGAEAAAVVAYGALVPPALLDAFPWVNLHFSLLPRWRGAAPVPRAIEAGDTETGAMAFLLEEGLDTGPVLATIRRPIGPAETAGDVLAALAEDGAPLLVSVFDALENGTATPVPQPANGVTLAPRMSPAEAQVDWGRGAAAVDRSIRAFTPQPGAWALLADGTRIKIGPVTPEDGRVPAGQVEVTRDGVRVGTGDGSVLLGQVAPAGKQWMEAAAWARGVRTELAFEVTQ